MDTKAHRSSKHTSLADKVEASGRVFDRSGHILSYKQLLKIDTALAEHTLQSMKKRKCGVVFPPKLSSNVFIHYTADNIDINDSTVDGKNTFHATQTAP